MRELRITGPGTDLRIVVEGRKWEAADGHYNMPDGEVYTSPVETETEGEISFSFPALFHGREVDGIRLRFEDGKVVSAEARRGGDFLEALLDLDEGARRLGEVAFGLNYEIDRFTSNTLFDEKIGGTMHVALGSALRGARRDERLGAALGPRLRPPGRRRGLRRRRAHLARGAVPRALTTVAVAGRLRRRPETVPYARVSRTSTSARRPVRQAGGAHSARLRAWQSGSAERPPWQASPGKGRRETVGGRRRTAA